MPLGKRTDFGDARYSGIDITFTPDIEAAIQDAMNCGFDFVVAPLVDPNRRPSQHTNINADGTMAPPFLPNQVIHTMDSAHLSNQIVGKVSSWIDTDSDDAQLRAVSLTALLQELAWASHMTVQACLLTSPPRPDKVANYIRYMNNAVIDGTATMPLWLTIPICNPSNDDDDPWEYWNQVRFGTHHSTRIGVALLVGPDLPSEANIARWWGEPVRALIISTDSFLTNKRGYPALSKRHQDLVAHAFEYGIQIILTGQAVHSVPAPPPPPSGPPPLSSSSASFMDDDDNDDGLMHPLRIYWEYISYIFRKQASAGPNAELEAPYKDYLQAPLQPLMDNLESQTYEVFERDGTKYTTYGEAVRRALLDRVPEANAATTVTILMVVGAGRGPLVSASLKAAQDAGRRLKVYAVEKNPNALVHVYARAKREGWGDAVEIVHADMRQYKAPVQADILVSELLGSFGDNELSPECLDGAQRFLKPDGISIPSAYTSYLQPITTHKLWTSVNSHNDLEHFETPFVVKLHRFTPLAPCQEVFTFVHPNKDPVIDNTRAINLTFTTTNTETATVCHGFAGYFDAELYKDVHLSIHPDTHTPDMNSWFPIYFPIRQPLYLPPGAIIQAHMWRCSNKQKIWYEWSVSQPQSGALHNPNGRSYYVGL